MLTEEAETLPAVDLNSDDNTQDLAPFVSPAEAEGLECSVRGTPAEPEDLSNGEPETAQIDNEEELGRGRHNY